MGTKGRTKRPSRITVAGIASVALILTSGISRADTWTGAVDDVWSTDANWMDGTAPTPTDSVTFDAGDSGGLNIVDSDLQNALDPVKMIEGLDYTGNGVHETRVDPGITLHVKGPVNVGVGGDGDGATAIWTGGGTLTVGESGTPQPLSIGVNNTASGLLNGTLSAEDTRAC